MWFSAKIFHNIKRYFNAASDKFSVIYSPCAVCDCVERWSVLVSQWSSWECWHPDLNLPVTPALFYCSQPTTTSTCRHPLDSMAHNTPGCILVHSLTFLSTTYTWCRTGSKLPLEFLLFLTSSCLTAHWADLAGWNPLLQEYQLLSYVFYHVVALKLLQALLDIWLKLGHFCIYLPYV